LWSSSDYVTPLDVKQYVYCPVIPWLIRNLGVREVETFSMAEARKLRALKLQSVQRLGLEPPVRVEVPMRSPELRLRGVADIVSGSRRLVVVEVKAYPRRGYEHFKWQLLTYALLAERCLGPTKAAILVLGERARAWDVTLEALKAAEALVQKTIRAVESEKPPEAKPSAKCASCWYRRYCPHT
jgi:CRISPR-associated exonuclease Cas4